MCSRLTVRLALAMAAVAGLAFAVGYGVVFGKPEQPRQRILIQAKAAKFNGINPPLEVRRGVPLEITIRNEESGAIAHDFVLVGLGLRTAKPLQPGESSTLRFTPASSGEFAYTCTLHPGLMDGRLIVRP